MSAGAMRGLNQDVTAFEMDRGVFAALADGEFRALVHLHARTIAEPDKSMTAIGSTDGFIFGELIAGADCLLTTVRNAIQPPVNGFNGGPRSGRSENPVALHEECSCANRNNNHGSNGIQLPGQGLACSRRSGR